MQKAALLLLTLSISSVSWAQQAVTEPEFSEVFFRLDNGRLSPLQRETAVLKAKVGGFIVVNAKTTDIIPGPRSPIRFTSGASLEFVVRTAFPPTVDPAAIYVLRKLDARKKDREYLTTETHATPFHATSTQVEGQIAVQFAKYGQASLKLTTPSLQPGEYAISRQYSQTVYCFGVD